MSRLLAVGPGFIRTPLLDNLPSEMLGALASLHPIGRIGEASEVAGLVLWLSLDGCRLSSYTGASRVSRWRERGPSTAN